MVATLNELTKLANTFCNSGDKTATIPVSATGTNAVSLAEGFPLITSTATDEGGIPPKRTDMNKVLNLLSEYCYYLQNGGTFTFSSDVSTAIGGYPEDAILDFFDGIRMIKIKSLIPNNTNMPSGTNIQYVTSPEGTYYWACTSLDTGLKNLTEGLSNTICTTPATTTSSATNERPAVVVKNWVSGTEWYRIWSDGWCEQGGKTNANATINFKLQMKDTNYTASSTMYDTAQDEAVAIYNRQTTLMQIVSDRNVACSWKVEGYCTGQTGTTLFNQTAIGNGSNIVNQLYTKTFDGNAILSINLGGAKSQGNGGELKSTISVSNGDTIKAVSINGYGNTAGIGVGIMLNNTPILYAGGSATGYTGGSGYQAGLKTGGVSGNTGYDYNGQQLLTFNDWSGYMTSGTACGTPYHTSNGTANGGNGYIASAYSSTTTFTNASNSSGAYIKIVQYV